MSRQFALTTSDNPFNPITQWEKWFAYDNWKGYKTCQYLGRIAHTGDGVSDAINDEIIESAMDEIIKQNLICIETNGKVCYMKVEEGSP